MKCRKCLIDKLNTEFSKDKQSKDGILKTCKVCKKQIQDLWKLNNKDKVKITRDKFKNSIKGREYFKQYYISNKEQIKQNTTKNVANNLDKIIAYRKVYNKTNRESINKVTKAYYIKYPWRKIWRGVLNNTLCRMNKAKKNKTINLLGYTYNDLKNHLENQFTINMNWNNYGIYWVVDHIKPVSKFDQLTNVKEVCALYNLQPLEKIENLKKSNKYENKI